MMTQRVFPSLPQIGQPEMFYAKMVHRADKVGDTFAHDAWKVGQYVTLALAPNLTWDQKLKYFNHALKRHCCPPPFPDDEVWMFFRQLADIVRSYAGQEALRLASIEDDLYARRVSLGQSPDKIADEAHSFFRRLLPDCHCPTWLNQDDFRQLLIIRDQWI